MDKKRAIETICEAAKIYNDIFIQKSILVVFNNPTKPLHIEICGLARNFAHLTGVDLNENIKDNSPQRFFEKALGHKISDDDFEIKSTTKKKLEILSQTLKIFSNAKMIADYEPNLQNRPNLETETIIGGERSYIGFIDESGKYIPNTVINGSIKNDSTCQSRVLAILSKKINEPSYNEIKYVAKKIDIDRLLQTIKGEVSISSDLLTYNSLSISTQPNVNLLSVSLTPSEGTAVLTPPRMTFGQTVSSFFGKIKQFCEDKSTENKRMIEQLQKFLDKRTKQLSERNEEIAALKKENAELNSEIEKLDTEIKGLKAEKTPVKTAAQAKSFLQGLDEFAERQRTPKAKSTPISANKKPPRHGR